MNEEIRKLEEQAQRFIKLAEMLIDKLARQSSALEHITITAPGTTSAEIAHKALKDTQ